ncbi:hypothetical protein [Stenoxybacter acetivorans]|uniref:hypothetical protein n=1 Tax=Stenoxybacter acetivorans TaxID=422441 RepID=UPI00055E88B3|nr:hypothetical protein [Stenoxybacter acetivorans]
MSPTEKWYYGAVILIAAVSVLLSPFFYIQRGKSARVQKPVVWRWIVGSYLIIGAILLCVFYSLFWQ